MAGIPMTVTAVPAFPTQVPFNSSYPPLPAIANASWASRFGPPDDLVVISARRVNSILPSLITASMALGLVVSDWSIHLPWEWKLLSRRKKWKLSHIAYFASRIGGLGFSICAILHSVVGNVAGGPMELGARRWDYANMACSADRRAMTFFSMLSIAGSSGILLLRCLALYRFNIIAVVSLGLLWLATPAFLIVNIFVLTSGSKRNGISACDPAPPKKLSAPIIYMMPWFVLPIFDSTILVLSLLGLRRASHRRRSSPLERMFRKDNIFYYAIVFLCVIPIPIWYLRSQRDGRMMPYLNLYIGLSSILSCRMFINLWKAIGRELALAHTFGSNTQDPYRIDTSMDQATAGLVGSRVSLPTSEVREGPDSIAESASPTDASAAGASPLREKAPASSTSIDTKSASALAITRDSDAVSSTQSPHATRYRSIVPDWTDVDPDLAYSLNGDYYEGANSLSYDHRSRGMHSTPF
ncbi:hypothetical protein PSEUBRA_002890 [Kalmanozyma brasiliensis GHG001]|uniref:Uncharacterized protein n=1 Tax=Kalmanozyma brasiliensis (strain GHG001) TaxID=1365824 RepID=V5EBJ1_KALBG|nr:uncharacterized protein PSEUBRA_002890 [Kalmanozyma brasiliensis GHG001]EST07781.1 hypothetical protein PSEUBRA_002890 [Kalmanozyma brasiliensis GHG001]